MKNGIEKNNASYQIRHLNDKDIGEAMELSKAEKWNQKEEDWARLIRNPDNICLAAVDGEKIIGTGTAIVYADSVAWIGMMLVEQNYRGRGVGKLIFSDLLKKLQLIPLIKLDATPVGRLVYQKFGFKDEYLIHRMTIAPVSKNSVPADEGFSPVPLKITDIPEIIEFDRRIFGVNRKSLLESLIKAYPEKSWVVRRNGRVEGFALGRDGTHFHQIGPVMASSLEGTKNLILKSLSKHNDQPVVIDVLDDKKQLIQWLGTIGFSKKRYFVRMYQMRNRYDDIRENHYLVCGPEFG